MLYKLDEYLKDFEMDDYALDYWYDEGFSIAQDMLAQFKEIDWEMLKIQMKYRDLGWKKRLVYCLNEYDSLHEIEILYELMETEDEELFESIVDSLRCHNFKKMQDFNVIRKEYFEKIVSKLNTSDTVEKKIMSDFLSKLENESKK